jgi:hypothetical protein
MAGDSQSGALAEFAALRQENEGKIKTQQQMLSLQFTVSGAIFGRVISRADVTALLLVVPISSFLLAGRFVSQHYGIHRIGRYIREELDPRVVGGLGWETWIRRNPRTGRLVGWTLPLLITFPGPALAALAWTGHFVFARSWPWSYTDYGVCAVWGLGLCFAALTAYLLWNIRRVDA